MASDDVTVETLVRKVVHESIDGGESFSTYETIEVTIRWPHGKPRQRYGFDAWTIANKAHESAEEVTP